MGKIEQPKPATGWVPMQNGILNTTAVLDCFDGCEPVPDDSCWRPLTPALFTTTSFPYRFDPAMGCPKWLQYLADVQPHAEDRHMLQMLCGLMLIPETRFNVFFLLHGQAGTGKSVFLYVLERLVGRNNTCCVPLTKFDDDHYSWQLTENLLNSVDDMGTAGLKNVEGVIKIATDGRELDIRRLYADGTKAPVIARTVAACNTVPKFYERSAAIWDRLRIIPFEVRIRDTAKQNSRLRYEIADDELPGVFNWALKGLADLRDMTSFPEHSQGLAYKDEHKELCDPEGAFLKDSFEANADCRVESSYIYHHYKEWADENGYFKRSAGELNKRVEQIFGIPKKKIRQGGRLITGFQGLGRKPDAGFAEQVEEEF